MSHRHSFGVQNHAQKPLGLRFKRKATRCRHCSSESAHTSQTLRGPGHCVTFTQARALCSTAVWILLRLHWGLNHRHSGSRCYDLCRKLFCSCNCASLLDTQLSLFSSGLPQIGNLCLSFKKAASNTDLGRLALQTFAFVTCELLIASLTYV